MWNMVTLTHLFMSTARPDLANRALKAEKPIPVEAGLIGIISLVDIMESVLQDRIYDETDIRDRDKGKVFRFDAENVFYCMKNSHKYFCISSRAYIANLGGGNVAVVCASPPTGVPSFVVTQETPSHSSSSGLGKCRSTQFLCR